MSIINYFAKYIPESNTRAKKNLEVWSYTRVSSKSNLKLIQA